MYFSTISAILLMAASSVLAAENVDGWEQAKSKFTLFEGVGYYSFHEQPLTWGEAWRNCIDENAHLVIVNSKAEEAVLKGLYQAYPSAHFSAWIGSHDLFLPGQYATVLGQLLSKVGYMHWSPNEPNAVGKERCMSITNQGGLHDDNCSARMPSICEHEV